MTDSKRRLNLRAAAASASKWKQKKGLNIYSVTWCCCAALTKKPGSIKNVRGQCDISEKVQTSRKEINILFLAPTEHLHVNLWDSRKCKLFFFLNEHLFKPEDLLWKRIIYAIFNCLFFYTSGSFFGISYSWQPLINFHSPEGTQRQLLNKAEWIIKWWFLLLVLHLWASAPPPAFVTVRLSLLYHLSLPPRHFLYLPALFPLLLPPSSIFLSHPLISAVRPPHSTASPPSFLYGQLLFKQSFF